MKDFPLVQEQEEEACLPRPLLLNPILEELTRETDKKEK
jgi:hypothetical protein